MVIQFGGLQDPGIERGKRNSLVDVVSLSIRAVIANAEGWEDIEESGELKLAWLRMNE